MDHDPMVEETHYLASTCEQGVGLKWGLLSVHHLLAEGGPRVRVDGNDDENLEWVEAPKWGFVRIPGNNEG
jgi:hypothetical protein